MTDEEKYYREFMAGVEGLKSMGEPLSRDHRVADRGPQKESHDLYLDVVPREIKQEALDELARVLREMPQADKDRMGSFIGVVKEFFFDHGREVWVKSMELSDLSEDEEDPGRVNFTIAHTLNVCSGCSTAQQDIRDWYCCTCGEDY